MNSLTKYPIIAEAMINVSNANGYIISPEESHAINKLRSRSGRQLVIVYPSATGSGSQDNMHESEQTIIFVLEKFSAGNKESDEINKYSELQQATLDILDFVAQSKQNDCEFFREFSEDGYNIDPVYNMFGGWSGWSIDLIF